ncbi:MAG: molybdopterin cofactor-binding domain-containing protein, partial [Myxococcota bacterium]
PTNQVTLITPHSELGQGSNTALAMMLAEEMDADWSLVDYVPAPALPEYVNTGLGKGFLMGDMSVPSFLLPLVDFTLYKLGTSMDLQITGGSTAIRFTGESGIRRAGAAAKAMMVNVAAQRWGVDTSEISVAKSVVSHGTNSATFGELATEAAKLAPPQSPTLKDRSKFTLIGTSQPRRDIPAKVNGSAVFGIDIELPNMVYAAVKQSPVFGGSVKSVNADAINDMPGVLKVVQLDHAVAVVADKYWRARKALEALPVTFDSGPHADVSSQTIFAAYEDELAQNEGSADVSQGDTKAALAEAAEVIESAYTVPFLAHSTMEPMNCTAVVKDGKCEIWTGSQNPLGNRTHAAKAIGIDPGDVTVHNQYMGGGFGRRASGDYVEQAVQIAAKLDRPVKLIWSREEDTQHDYYRPAVANRFKAALGSDGLPVAWSNRYIDVGQNEPAEAPEIPYGIVHQEIRKVSTNQPIPTGPWRSVGHTQHSFFNESFIDELAHKAGQDPFEYRRRLLKDQPRHKKVLETAAQKAGWGTPLPPGRARGIALEQSFDSIVAQVAEVSLSEAGEIKVHRVCAAIDCGTAINPNSVEAQIQGGIIYGLTAALYGDITIKEGRVEQSNFHDYR